ncbi:LytTR family transcriptional regulator DNA-binding domain-containing protein [Roseivirga sp. UBA1976]|uniref:LytTR family transcriptional regulator DNA-binding domain-containing protein n=1 Tax=Roseivirga sp. UBA1976 TaxID=1947386 RepID=UPI00258035B6|nr:LytTR family transcriptional regulator DNA-binding domain-containing protein [Roseivirga sp. UBA1976]MEC7754269.1 LytTR family transcriptional regulator DNA-binding domain-containing protein [Bacteroidota bacterium]
MTKSFEAVIAAVRMSLTPGRIYSILLLLVLTTMVSAQQNFDYLMSKARENSRNPDSLSYYGKVLLEKEDSLSRLEGYFAIGYAAYQSGSIKQAVAYYDSALFFTNRKKLRTTYDRIVRNQAIAYQRMGEIDKAKQIYEQMLVLADDEKSPIGRALALNQLGILEQMDGNFEKASKQFNEALDLYKKHSPEGMVNTMLNLGTLYGRMDLIDKSNTILKEAAATAMSFKQPVLAARCYNNISVNFRKIAQLDSSNTYLKKSLPIYTATRNTLGLVNTYQNIAHNFLEAENQDSCYHYLHQARALNEPGEDMFLSGELDFLEAQAELKFGETAKAIALINQSITKALTQQRIDDLRDRYEFLSEAYEKDGQDKLALQILKKWKALDDSLEYFKNIKTIDEITAEYDLARSEILVESTRVKTNLTRNLIIVSVITLLVVGLAYTYYRNFRKERNEKLVKENELEQLKEKLRDLTHRSQLATQREFITLKSKALLKLEEIKYIQSDGPYIEIYLDEKQKPEVDRNTLKNILSELPSNKFIQVHRSYIVNIDHIKSIYATKLVLEDGTELNVSRSFKEEVESLLNMPA